MGLRVGFININDMYNNDLSWPASCASGLRYPDEFLTGELFLPWRTANQYLVFCSNSGSAVCLQDHTPRTKVRGQGMRERAFPTRSCLVARCKPTPSLSCPHQIQSTRPQRAGCQRTYHRDILILAPQQTLAQDRKSRVVCVCVQCVCVCVCACVCMYVCVVFV
jgi:hypothetical protein